MACLSVFSTYKCAETPIISRFFVSSQLYRLVTAKKGNKKVSKTLTAKAAVINAELKFTTDSTNVTVGEETKLAVKVCPSTANVTYKSSDDAIATVAADGTVKGVKAGEVKISATSDYGKTVETTVTVKDDAATKIDSVTATSVKTLEVKFDGKVKDSATGKFKVTRAGTEVAMTAKWAEDNKSVILTSESALQAGTYTVAYGEMTGTVVVTAQKATKIQILTSKIGLSTVLGSQKRIYYTVLDQYGNDMGVASNKLTISATNMNKNSSLTVTANANKTNTYFDINVPAAPSSSIGDKIAVVAYLTTDVSVNVSANIEIANIYTKSFAFGEADKAKDAQFFVDKTDYSYSLPYTATDSEGDKVLLEKTTGTLANSGSTGTTNNITFVSSNPSTINPADFKIDSDGKLTFKTGSYASTVTITALNTVTGESTNISITVGKKSTLSKVEVTDVTIPMGFNPTGTVKAEIVGYDQYGTVISAANLANLNLSANFNYAGSAYAAGTTATVTKDGKYVEFANLAIAIQSAAIGTKFNMTFISKTDATLSSNATFIIGDATVASYFKIDSSAVDTLFAAGNGKLKVTVYDNYDQEMTTGFSLTPTASGKVSIGSGSLVGKQTEYVVTASSSVSGVSENGTIDILLKDANNNEVERKTVAINVSNIVDKLIVSTDKDTYASGDKINVDIKAYNGNDFLSNLNTTLAVTVVTYNANSNGSAVDTKVENLAFKNGVATTTVDAKAAVKSVGVAVKSAGATGNVDVDEARATALTVNAPSADTKYGVALAGTSITITAQNAVGETVTGYAGNKAISVKVEKKTALGTEDVTGTYITDKDSILSFSIGVVTVTTDRGTVPTSDADNIYTITVTENGGITGSCTVK